MSYPHLERRFDVVKDKLRAFVLEAARCLARPTWRCGQRDLLVTLLHTEPQPVWYAGGAAVALREPGAAAVPSSAALGASRPV